VTQDSDDSENNRDDRYGFTAMSILLSTPFTWINNLFYGKTGYGINFTIATPGTALAPSR
jgi:hypothetical protein